MNKLVFLVFASVALLVQGGVYDDAIYWFRGGKTTGTGTSVKLFDEMHASNTNHANHAGAQFYGRPESRAIVEDDVVFPCWRENPIRTKVLRLSCDPQVSGTTTNLWLNWAYAKFLRPQFSNEYTMVMRLKYQAGPTTNSTRWLARFGYNGDSGGVLFGVNGNDATTNRSLVCCYQTKKSDGTSAYAWGQTTLRVPPTNVWFDVSLMVSNNVLRVGVARPSVYWSVNPVQFATISEKVFPTYTTGPESVWRFFTEKGDTAATPFASAYKQIFVGSIQQIAIWNRGLSDQEIREAWGSPGVDLWQVGLSNDGSNEFSAEAASATQTIDPYRAWSTVTPRLAAGNTWTIPFHGMENEAGFAQIFRLTPTSASAEGLISVRVNGTALGSKPVGRGRTTEWYVPNGLLVNGSNTLTLTRADTGAADIVVDTMALGGSWQIGVLSLGDFSNMTSEGRVDTIPTTLDICRRHWPHANNLNSWSSNRTYRVWVPKHIADRYPTAFGFYSKVYELNQSNRASLNLYVNDVHHALRRTYNNTTTTVEEADGTTGKDRVYYEAEFEPGVLQEGWNEFSLRGHKVSNVADGKGYFLFNAYRWYITGHPPCGTMLLVR